MEGLGPEQARVENDVPDEEHTTAVMRISPVEHHLLAMPEGEQLPQNNNQVPDHNACCTTSRGCCSPKRIAAVPQSAWLHMWRRGPAAALGLPMSYIACKGTKDIIVTAR
jgi:hypothetical protein